MNRKYADQRYDSYYVVNSRIRLHPSPQRLLIKIIREVSGVAKLNDVVAINYVALLVIY